MSGVRRPWLCINSVLFSLPLQPPISDGYWLELACRSCWWFWYIYTLLPQLIIWLVWWVCMMGKISLHPHVPPLGLRLGPRSMGKMQFKKNKNLFPPGPSEILISKPRHEAFWALNVPHVKSSAYELPLRLTILLKLWFYQNCWPNERSYTPRFWSLFFFFPIQSRLYLGFQCQRLTITHQTVYNP